MQIQKTIGEFVGKTQVPLLDVSATVSEALALMESLQSACVLVTEDEKLAGIFTESDFLVRVAGPRLSSSETTLDKVMTAKPHALKLHNCITYAVNLMAEGGYRNVPIIDDMGRPVSNLSVYDVTGHLAVIFSEVNDTDDGHDEWTDIGGG